MTVLESVLGRQGSVADRIETFVHAGIPRVGLLRGYLESGDWNAELPAIDGSKIDVTHLGHASMFTLEDPNQWDRERQALRQTIDVAVALGARCVYGTTGGGVSMEWEQAADAFCAAVQPIVVYAGERSMPFLIEPTIVIYADMSIVHTFRDTVDLATRAGVGVCIDLKTCWWERGLEETISRAARQIGLVQMSDYVPGKRTVDAIRAVPGDGVVPLERHVDRILGAGYAGLFDLELGYEPDLDFAQRVGRGANRVGGMLS